MKKFDLMRELGIGPIDLVKNAMRAAMQLGIYMPRRRDRQPVEGKARPKRIV